MKNTGTYISARVCRQTLAWLCLISGILSPLQGYAFTDGAAALDVIGQYEDPLAATLVPVFTKSGDSDGPNKLGLSFPMDIEIDAVHDRLFVLENQNRRILVYNLNANDTLTDHVPDYVLGQSDFFSATSLATTQSTLLGPLNMVYDSDNDRLFVGQIGRVLVFDTASITNGEDAVSVLGQSSFTAASTTVSQTGLSIAEGLAYDNARDYLYVSDSANRVLVYDVAAITDGENAIHVLGQSDFTSSTAANTQAGMNNPVGLAYDEARQYLFVVQGAANRVVVYDLATIADGEDAISVLGQDAYAANNATTTQSGMNAPAFVDYGSGTLYVADRNNNRITMYDMAMVGNSENAIDALGQNDDVLSADPQPVYTKDDDNDGPNLLGMATPNDIELDETNHRLFVTDTINNRVIVYNLNVNNTLVDHIPDRVLGQSTFVSNTPVTTQSGMNGPVGVAYDPDGNRLFVSQSSNARVTVYDTASITNGEAAVNVLGQTTFTATASANTQAGLSTPGRITYEAGNDYLYVSEINGNRLKVFDVASITDGENAIDLFGEYDDDMTDPEPVYTKDDANDGPNKLGYVFSATSSLHTGMALDSTHNRLFISDTANNRVLVYNMYASGSLIDRVPDYVLGQADFASMAVAVTQSSMISPRGLAYDSTNDRLFVANPTMNRVMVYDTASITNGEAAINVLGQSSFTTSTAANTQTGMSTPQGIAYDSTRQYLFVAQGTDSISLSGNRVTVYDVASITDGEAAINVLGQSSFTAGTAANTQAGMNGPRALAYDDARKYLFVGQFGSSSSGVPNRVTVYDTATITDGENAINVLGQSLFTATTAANTQAGLNGVQALTYEPTRRLLFVAQGGTSGTVPNRVSIFDMTAITTGEAAVNVLGQTTFTATTRANTQAGMSQPTGVVIDDATNRLYVAQSGNKRVTIYDLNIITNGEAAIDALGQYADSTLTPQPSFTKSAANDGPNIRGFSAPNDVAVDTTNHRLFIADSTNNRVLVYNLGADNTIGDRLPDHVLGQADYVSNAATNTQTSLNDPQGLIYDSDGNRLFVTQAGSHRVSVFDVSSISDGEGATNVLGQTNFTNASNGSSQAALNSPEGMAFDATNDRLYVAASNNNRIIVFDVASITDGENAVDVLGQYSDFAVDPTPSYTRVTADNGPHKLGLRDPSATALDPDNHRLFVSDSTNARILVYNLDANNELANHVPDNILGTSDYFAVPSGTTQSTILNPLGLAYDAAREYLYAVSSAQNRVLVYDVAAISDGENAINVLGQSLFTTTSPGTTQVGLSTPIGIVYDDMRQYLFVSQTGTNRVSVFDLVSITDGEAAIKVLGQSLFTTASAANTQAGLNQPNDMAYDPDRQYLFVTGNQNNRVTVFDVATITDGEAAINVLGQPDFTTITGANTQVGMNDPVGLAYDDVRDYLFVGQENGSRVTIYDMTTITDGEAAMNILGQGADFSASIAANTQAGMKAPEGVEYDSARQYLLVSQSGNHRVTVYDVSSVANGNAINVLGQANFTSFAAANTQAGMNSPQGIEFDATNKLLYVSQANNNRITVYDTTSLTDGENAVDLLGHYSDLAADPTPSYTKIGANNAPNKLGFSLSTNAEVDIDSVHHRLFLADNTNRRVLVYNLNSSDILVDYVPDHVLGQPNFVSNESLTTQDGMSFISGIAYDSVNDRLFVSQQSVNRVTVYDTASITDGENAINVLGQALFTTSTAANSQTGLNAPFDVEFDSARNYLYVANNNRVMVYDTASITDGENAINVLGQSDFTTVTAANTQAGLNIPLGLAYDPTRQYLFVSQNTGNRVSVFDIASISDGEAAINVLGQPNFTTITAANTQAGLKSPQGIAFDDNGDRLFVSQTGNHRVTVFNVSSITDGEDAVGVVGQIDFTTFAGANTQAGMNSPTSVEYDAINNRLYVGQSGSKRVTIYDVADADTDNPDVLTRSPADDATDVAVSENLVITFDEVTRAGTGTLTIKKTSDDSMIEAITISGALLSGNGTTQLTFNPATTLDAGTSYYIVWDANAFKDASGNHSSALTLSTAWNFQTAAAVGASSASSVTSAVSSNTSSTDSSSSEAASAASVDAQAGTASGGGGGRGASGPGARSPAAAAARQALLDNYKEQLLAQQNASSAASAHSRSSAVTIVQQHSSARSNASNASASITIAENRGYLQIQNGLTITLFRDVPIDAWYAPYVSFLLQEKIARGYTDDNGNLLGEFGVADPVTYAELAKLVLESSGNEPMSSIQPPRNTSARGTWASSYIAQAEKLGLSIFDPSVDVHTPATRGEVIQTILEGFGIPAKTKSVVNFSDLPASHEYAQAIAVAVFYGLIDGDTDAAGNSLGTVRPDDEINRAEVAKIVAMAYELLK